MRWGQIRENDQVKAILQAGEKTYIFPQTLDQILLACAQKSQGMAMSIEEALSSFEGQELATPLISQHLIQPLIGVQKVLCLGLNYTDHAAEVGAETPQFPTIFTKFANSLIGPNDPIRLPLESSKIDWEAELALVIGRTARRVPEEKALDYLAGYTVLNDVSVRDWQGRTSEWFQGKNWDATTPWGPFVVPSSELDPVAGLAISCTVDGQTRQEGNTSQMIFSPAQVISYISTFMTLEPGDLISLGTPAGVGLSLHPRNWLRAGQLVETSIDGIGTLSNLCADPS